MPFLRPVGSSVPPLEIRSAKTLIGSSQSKCDVVLPRDRGMLDLHALLNLSDDHRATTTLVPFSVTGDGACFLNGRLVPPEGAAVVHGDRIAFGNAENAFVYTLTEPRQRPVPVETASLSNARSFRRTLDALRGDRSRTPVKASSASQSTTKKAGSINKPLSASASRERLEKFLLDASTDSLLGDFVERKLQSSSSASASRRQRQREPRPAVMDPPPSLSASSVNSLRSSLNDSILDRSTLQQGCPSARNAENDPLRSGSQSLLSTAERNYAEIEKLRLSQRMREVNNVLNGHLQFGSSYLSTERRSSGTASMRFASPVKVAGKRTAPDEEDHDEKNEESVEELPVMVEKPPRKPAVEASRFAPPLDHHPTPESPLKSSIVSSLGKSLHGHETHAHVVSSRHSNESVELPVDESLPSFSEAIMKQPARPNDNTERVALSTPPPIAASQPVAMQADPVEPRHSTRRARSQLHQQLIDRTLRLKRHECLTDAFHRLRRGLRIQQQRRREKAKQLQLSDRKLQLLRRNHTFWRWKQWTEHRHQVLECREEAFVQRQRGRIVRSLWTQWIVVTLRAKHARRLLRRCVVSIGARRIRLGFQRWRVEVERLRSAGREQCLVRTYESNIERRMEAVAQSHHQTRITYARLQRVVRAWRGLASQRTTRKRVLRRMLQTGFRRDQRQAWNTWKNNAMLIRQAHGMDQHCRNEVATTSETAARQLQARELELHDQYEKQISELRTKLEEQQERLRAFEEEKQEAKKRRADVAASAKARWAAVSEELLKNAVAEADAQTTELNVRLEASLQQMDVEPEAARFQAASFLVESMLEQKMRHVNARVGAQEALQRAMDNSDEEAPVSTNAADTKPGWRAALTSNGRFLLEMVQQRHARLHQLYQAIAKLAATVVERNDGGLSQLPTVGRVDAAKFQHAAFLTDTMHDRTLQQLDAVLSIHHRCCAVTTRLAPREARKY